MALGKNRPATPAEATPAVADTDLVRVDTSFDYLAGSFTVAERGRQMFVLICALSVLALASLAFFVFTTSQDTATAREDTSSLQGQIATVQAELDRIDQADGIPADLLRTHAAKRQAVYKQVLANETDAARLLSQVLAATPAGVTLTGFQIEEPQPKRSTDGADGNQDQKDAQGAAPATPSQKKLTITAAMDRFSSVQEFSANLARIPGFGEFTPTWSGGADSLTFSASLTVSEASRTGRAIQAQLSDTYGLPQRTQTTSGTTTPAGAN